MTPGGDHMAGHSLSATQMRASEYRHAVGAPASHGTNASIPGRTWELSWKRDSRASP